MFETFDQARPGPFQRTGAAVNPAPDDLGKGRHHDHRHDRDKRQSRERAHDAEAALGVRRGEKHGHAR